MREWRGGRLVRAVETRDFREGGMGTGGRKRKERVEVS